MKRLTDLELRRLAKRAAEGLESPREIREGEGFGVAVLPSGKLSFFLLYTLGGVRRRIRFGTYPETTLAAARDAVAAVRAQLAEGLDPAIERTRQRNAVAEAVAEERRRPTVRGLVEEYTERHLPLLAESTRRRALLELKEIVRAWGARKACEITRRDVVLLIDKVRDLGTGARVNLKGAPSFANSLQSRVRDLFRFAVERAIVETSPALVLPKKSAETERERVLSDAEILAFWRGLDRARALPMTRTALRLILLTGQRPGEVAGMRWDELDLPAALWRLPAERTKTRRAHTLPLSAPVLELIEQARRQSTSAVFVFPGTGRNLAGSINTDALAGAVGAAWQAGCFDDAEGNRPERHTAHDLRRTCRTGLSRLGVSPIVAERVLNHALPLPGVAAVYDRHDYLTEMRAALDAWAAHVLALVNGQKPATNVIPLPVRSP